MKPKISIITVCYNSEKIIEKTIKSVLAQKDDLYEYLIIDGKSTDGTLGIVDQYKPLFNGKMKVLSEPDQGIYDAMNKGIKLATGDLINMMNSDDTLEPNALRHVIEAYKENNSYQVLYGMIRIMSGELERSIERFSHHFLGQKMINHQSLFISKALHDQYGLYDTQYKYAADHDFLLKIKDKPEVEFVPVDAVIANYAIGGVSSGSAATHEKAGIRLKYGAISKKKYVLLRLFGCVKDVAAKQ